MSIFKQCLFYDGLRKIIIEIDDIIEDNYLNSTCNDFYVMFYFTATWVPNGTSEILNHKIQSIYHERKSSFNNFELIFVSSDKSLSEYRSFLKNNAFIRYSLDFSDQDLKVQLGKFFNISSLPFVTIVKFEVDKDLKITSSLSETMNIKDFRLPWFDVEKSSQLTNKTTSLLDEILINMNRINSNDDGEIVETIESIKNMNNFIYILLVSNRVNEKKQILKSFTRFNRKFSKVHKFLFVYINLEKYDNVLIKNDWFSIKSKKLKEDIIKFHNVVEVPRLLILDLKTEELLNLKLTKFLSNHRYENQNRFVDESNYDYCLTNEVKFDRENLMKKCLKMETLDELKQSLINVNDAKNGLFKLNYYLLYFCSYHTVKNTQVFEKIITFLSNMQGKSKCSTSIILISSDSTEADYTNLINEFKSFTTKKYSIFKSYALNYGSKSLKEKLIKELRISAIPWFLLIDETNGDILCENMGAFILDNQMHSILF